MVTVYQNTIYGMIDFKEELKEKFEKLVDSSNNDMKFSKNPDGSIVCYTDYKGYNIAISLSQNEVFQYAWQRGKKPTEAIEEVIREKLFMELQKD